MKRSAVAGSSQEAQGHVECSQFGRRCYKQACNSKSPAAETNCCEALSKSSVLTLRDVLTPLFQCLSLDPVEALHVPWLHPLPQYNHYLFVYSPNPPATPHGSLLVLGCHSTSVHSTQSCLSPILQQDSEARAGNPRVANRSFFTPWVSASAYVHPIRAQSLLAHAPPNLEHEIGDSFFATNLSALGAV